MRAFSLLPSPFFLAESREIQGSHVADTTRSNIPFVMYLDCLSYRFQQMTSTPSTGPGTPKHPDAAYVMKMMLGSVKKSYEQRVSGIEPGIFVHDVASVVRGRCPIMDPSLKNYLDGATLNSEEVFSLSDTHSSDASSVHMPLYYDVWATMTGSWASEI